MSKGVARLGRRHRFFLQMFLICLLLLVSFALPLGFNRLTILWQIVMVLLLVLNLGEPGTVPGATRLTDRSYRALGLAALLSQTVWVLTPLSLRHTGVPVLGLWSLFVAWSTLRLVQVIAQEKQVNGRVLMGAAAGYLMLGLTAGLLFSVLETVQPGSFNSIHHNGGQLLVPRHMPGLGVQQVWELDFVRLNYFAFVSLTTVGYGDILPVTPLAQIASVSFSVIGPIYLVIVMGLLISRLTSQEVNEAVELAAARAAEDEELSG
ncbi:potassium channel family protein [Cyanobium sp. Morenito 9A2]|uniref:potassium channel family protein n=1 Tax=Cyanobium sp. Morenito 9A2 TaxID=2823718 RepID=UPI0020CDFB19|nr:potassium channel family protein [Cyanobium sp. Morenito 9A2]MCP9849701.1 two pore domain potassium channel family protein [Cyanobium sp. Morenito 9A2]